VGTLLAAPDSADWANRSVEFCGGTHVRNTAEAVAFVVTEEAAVAKGKHSPYMQGSEIGSSQQLRSPLRRRLAFGALAWTLCLGTSLYVPYVCCRCVVCIRLRAGVRRMSALTGDAAVAAIANGNALALQVRARAQRTRAISDASSQVLAP